MSFKGKQASQHNEAHLDSLTNHCYDLVVKLQTDTLRMVAEEYMKATEPYSKRYYKAKQTYLVVP